MILKDSIKKSGNEIKKIKIKCINRLEEIQ